MKNKYLLPVVFFLFASSRILFPEITTGATGDTTSVQIFRFDTNMRAGVFQFPTDTTKTYEKIIMEYRMRCKNGLVSTSANRNLGCGEWDYNCNTFIVDSSQTDSLHKTRANYSISNYTDTVFQYTSQPVWSYIQFNQQDVTYTSTISETTATVGIGTTSLAHPFSSASNVRRSQYLFTAAELTTAGLVAGDITSLRMELLTAGMTMDNLRIRIKHSTQSILNDNAPELTGFTEVYFLNTPFSGTGITPFRFSNPFNWNGTSNILVDVSFTTTAPGAASDVAGDNPGFTSSMSSSLSDSWLSFRGNYSYFQPDAAAFNTITDKITVAFWVNGDQALPKNTSILWGNDNSNIRQLNIHLPWTDSNIYFDCGGTSAGYDRINKAATTAEIKGQWNFWAFTKNATTGDMKIYLNGHLWASGTGKTKLIDLKQVYAGVASNGNPYYGDMDELSFWDKDLDSVSIQMIMNHEITAAHPDYSNLLAYYQFNEGSGSLLHDSSPHTAQATLINPAWRNASGKDLWKNFTTDSFRPNLTFVQGTYTTSVQTTSVLDSNLIPATSVTSYNVVNNSLAVVDTIYVWPSAYTYITDPNGVKLDSIFIVAEDTVHVTNLDYFDKRPMYIEMINFITPYGIGLNLDGLNGKTWEFDVTDYAPVLKGLKYMAMQGGNLQEDNDIKFVFYEGTPPRDVKSISNIWPNATWGEISYADIYNNVYFEPRTISLSPNASQFKVSSCISGHQQDGEFTPRNHTITLNGTTNFTRSVWVECATNPIYPQGGTWVYDRAGWCPGSAVVTKEFELTPYVSPGQTIILDYSMPYLTNPGASSYRVNNQLISYGAPNFSVDAAIYYIKSPSKRVEYTRINPLCDDPVIAIRNTGSTPLTSLTITYGRTGGIMSVYQWTGNLNFLESAEITLPAPNWLTSATERFSVSISNPSGGADQYPANDTMSSAFFLPDVYTGGIVFEFKANNYVNNNSYTLKDSQGNLLIYRNGAAANTTYRDTVWLAPGCYTVYMNDVGDDGLSWWANTAQGNGYFRIRSATSSAYLHLFEPDFGDNINYQFTMDYSLPVPELNHANPSMKLYPNPSQQYFTAEINGARYDDATITVLNPLGQEVWKEIIKLTQPVEKAYVDVSTFSPGIYYVKLETTDYREVQKMVITR